MTTTGCLRSAALLAALATTMLTESVASAADERERCAAAAEHAQQFRDEGKYRRAREQMLICAREVCPGPIRTDCGKWLIEVDRDAPTVVLGARDRAGNDVLDVKVSVDGAPLVERIDGKPVLVDAGEHTFKFEASGGVVKEERVLLRAAEKARPIIATLPIGSAPAPAASPTPEPAPAPREKPPESSLIPAIIVGGIGVVGIGSFIGFGLAGNSAVDDLESSKCKPNCNQDDVDAARAKMVIADISLVVGVAALGVASYMFLTRPKVDPKIRTGTGWHFDAGPVAGGAVGSLGAKF